MMTTLRVEDKLDGSMNSRSWKHIIQFILEENEVDDYVTKVILEPIDDDENLST